MKTDLETYNDKIVENNQAIHEKMGKITQKSKKQIVKIKEICS